MMVGSRVFQRRLMCSFHLLFCLSSILAHCFFTQCGASRELSSMAISPPPPPNTRKSDAKLNGLMKLLLDMVKPLDDNPQQPTSSGTNSQPYGVGSPFTLPPYDSLAPIPLPQNTPPFCIYPSPPPGPTNPIPSPPVSYSPSFPFPNPNPSPTTPPYIGTPMPPAVVVPSPPESIPSPSTYIPSPSIPVFNPPTPVFNPPSPSSGGGSGGGGGGGGGFVPTPVFLPPIVYPPPAVPPPPYRAPSQAMWCVAKPAVPGPIIQEALNYACASGAECSELQPGGPCYEPNTLIAHASFAFNSYWQRTKVAGGTCGFGGIAILVTVDPSHDGCHFMYA
ncbi:OLC1v1000929C1 [Oldenlandia corymbosa var. corymbosa]|uniref:OLC1v1000929C1 n=1 Tax=Oldenlandia corymbosa var. corymbosa TaxID=529605 RepID=A0AAV1D736_OLDCO|nr:OLC1v1000929C1 [Oldenlandia corymbosa var. corymbosa]